MTDSLTVHGGRGSGNRQTGGLPHKGATLELPCLTLDKERLFLMLSAQLPENAVLRSNEPLACRTTLRVGGCADIYFEPQSEAELAVALRFCCEKSVPFLVLGRGSNLLVRDGGVRGMVICLGSEEFSRIESQRSKLVCGAGAKLKNIANRARQLSLADLEFLEGIPGSLGGALRMNAGAMGLAIFDKIESVRFMSYEGVVFEQSASDMGAQYRSCPLLKTHIALSAVLMGELGSKEEEIAERMRAFSRKRWESQPKEPSAGCTFKNPPRIAAGKLIDQLGLKGARVGGAVVSTVHGNFIVNDGNATARDVLDLIETIQMRAKSAEGIDLDLEVEIVGEDLK